MTPASRRTGEAGFTLIEVLVASTILLVLVAAAFELLRAGEVIFVSQPEAVDLQQRLRVVADTLTRDLMMTGAGFSRGKIRGPLAGRISSIVPYRAGLRNADAPGSFYPDRFTVLYVPPGAPEATIGDPVLTTVASVRINSLPGCSLVNQACGFQAGTTVLVVDEAGRFNLFTVTGVTGNIVDLQLRDPALAAAFQTGASIAGAVVGSYSLKADPVDQTSQLMQYDGYRSEQPISDDIVGMRVEYFGDPVPPGLVRSLSDPDGPWTTYGPKPPLPGVDDPLDSWPAGENCVFSVQGTAHVPRLTTLGAAADGLVPLSAAMLTDGPWCPDALAPNRFDADLLRVRRVRVTLRAQVVSASLRGVGALFARPGTSHGGGAEVPDAFVAIDIAPRNLNAGR